MTCVGKQLSNSGRGALIERSADLFYDYAFAGDRTRWEGDLSALLDWSDTELPRTHREWLELIHPEDRVAADTCLCDLRKGAFSTHYRLRHRSGDYLRVEDRGVFYRDSDGCVTRRIGTIVAAPKLVSTRAKAEANTELIRDILDSMFVFVVVLTADWRIVEINNAPLQAGGMQRAEVLGRNFLETRWFSELPESQRQMQTMLQRVAQGETLREDFFVRFRGEIRVVDATYGPLCDETGQVIGIIGSGVDVTNRKQTEQTLAQLAREHEMILNAAGEGICGIDKDGRATFVNKAASRMFGYGVEELLGQTVHSLVHHSHPDGCPYPREKCPIYAALQDGITRRSANDVFWRKDGSSFHVEYISDPICDGGKVVGAVVAFSDITARIEAEEARAESDLRFRQVVENIRQVFWISDLAKNELYVSPGFDHVWGAPRSQFGAPPLGWLEHVHPEDQARIREALPRQPLGGYDEEFRIILPDGSIRWLRDRAFPVKNEKGVVYRVAGLAEDITESKRLDEQLRHSQKMEAVGQLASGVAHDFNNLLTVIQGNASLLLMQLEGTSPEAGYTRDIIQAAEQSAALTRQLLLFSSKQALEQRNLDINEIVSDVTRMLQRVLGENIRLATNFAPKLPSVYADSGMIEQILLNLAVNARDAMPDGGCLSISTRSEESAPSPASQEGEQSAGPYVCITVSDDGKGIPPDVLPRIFEPFFTTKGVGKGTGLGLATVYGIVQQHRGWIDVQSTLGEGTRFEIWLPARNGESKEAKQPKRTHSLPTGTGTILLVEDEAALRLISINILQRCGYTVVAAGDGPSALEVWKEHATEVDLLLTDMVMPGGITGRELARRLLAEKPDLKVIYTSGYSADVVGKDSVLVEGVNFLQKPYLAPKLATAVRDCMAREQRQES